MSYDVYILKRPYQPPPQAPKSWDEEIEHLNAQKVMFEQPHDIHGGTYAVGGTKDAWINITYNYGGIFARVLGQPFADFLQGRKVSDTLPALVRAVMKMRGEPDQEYWAPTEGNARAALVGLINLALLSPEATNGYWHVD